MQNYPSFEENGIDDNEVRPEGQTNRTLASDHWVGSYFPPTKSVLIPQRSIPLPVFMSPCCCNKSPGTQWLQTVFTFVLFHVHRSEVQYGSHWAKIKGVGRVVFLLEIRGENPFPCLFQFLEATDIPGKCPPPPSSKPTASYFSPCNSCLQRSTRAFSSHTFVRTYRNTARSEPSGEL